tara:strand:+ start:12996 stop:13139 length:144 start_codon:yes stop_codon:yes gene_type:complete
MDRFALPKEGRIRKRDDEMCCGFLWGQFMDANIDELVNFCPSCGEAV